MLSYYHRQILDLVPGVLPLTRPQSERGQLPNAQTRLCVEGVPRSANTFVLHCILNNLSVERHQIAHHTHSFGNIRRALRQGIPTFVLSRDPLDSALSYMIRFPVIPLVDLLKAYRLFYASVIPVLPRVTILPFESVTRNPRPMLESVAAALGIAGPEATDETILERTRASLNVKNEAREARHSSLPSPQKERLKREAFEGRDSAKTVLLLENCRTLRRRILDSARPIAGDNPRASA